jgi:hypothetical protein
METQGGVTQCVRHGPVLDTRIAAPCRMPIRCGLPWPPRNCIGWCMFNAGAIDDALHQLNFAVEEATRALGPRDTTVANRRIGIVEMLTEAGSIDSAEAQLTALEADYSHFPPGA